MASPTLRERLTGELSTYPRPREMTQETVEHLLHRSVSRLLEIIEGYVWEFEADASSRKDWLTANAYGDLTQRVAQ